MNQIDFDTNKLKTNFCRDIKKQSKKFSIPMEIVKTAIVSEKFILPIDGVFFQNKATALSIEQFRLPYKTIALEFFDSSNSKNVVFAKQVEDNVIQAFIAYLPMHESEWRFSPLYIQLVLYSENIVKLSYHKLFNDIELPDEKNKKFFYALIMQPIVEFLEALSCKNVSIESHAHRKKGKSKLDALPFDDYKVLCVNVNKKYDSVGNEIKEQGTHRSPREHLRRGHIRRLHKGNVWVQSTVVNPGIGGRIEKYYRIAA